MEIAVKIANKIRANERFAVYVVIPMWPEGDPRSIPMQRILFWQYKTMQMMYEIIFQALVEVGLQNKYEPQDYLNFFCLGTREVPDEHSTKPNTSSSADNSPQARSRKSRRFMIYVHSKGLVVDDDKHQPERSMDGTRDTEIAMGAYQPQYTWARRRSSPHMDKHPESLECVRRVRSRGEHNWSQYAAPEITDMRSHLLKYPLEVDPAGRVEPLHGCETFPDFDGKIMGSFVRIQENLTI
ncbi:Phospholipase D beta 1-like protein [Drosera capensis]